LTTAQAQVAEVDKLIPECGMVYLPDQRNYIFSCNKCIFIPGKYQKQTKTLNEVEKDKMLKIYLEVGGEGSNLK
jgi:hypothetical protein